MSDKPHALVCQDSNFTPSAVFKIMEWDDEGGRGKGVSPADIRLRRFAWSRLGSYKQLNLTVQDVQEG
jgi:hypothetical protein